MVANLLKIWELPPDTAQAFRVLGASEVLIKSPNFLVSEYCLAVLEEIFLNFTLDSKSTPNGVVNSLPSQA